MQCILTFEFKVSNVMAPQFQFIHIAVAEYIPKMIFKKPKRSWTLIDDRIRNAVKNRNVTVKFLVDDHASHASLMYDAIKSMTNDMNKNGQIFVQAKVYSVSFKAFCQIINAGFFFSFSQVLRTFVFMAVITSTL